jgi:hypothetical protein
LITFLHLFHPTCGNLIKSKEEKWVFVAHKILPKLSTAYFESVVKNYQGREENDLQKQIKDLRNEDENAGNAPKDMTADYNMQIDY